MNKRSFWYGAVGALIVAAGVRAGVAIAQPAGDASNAQPRRPGGVVELRSNRVANLSGPEQLRASQTIIDQLTAGRFRISSLLDRARTQDRDIIKVNCLGDKLNQADVNVRSSREHRELLETAVRVNNEGQRNHEYGLLVIFRQRGEALEGESRQCVGEESGAFGDRQVVSVIVNSAIPTNETDPFPRFNVILEVPPSVSQIR